MAARYLLRLGAGFLVVVGWVLMNATSAGAEVPEFRLVPDRGPCIGGPQLVRVQSANFTPGTGVVIMMTGPYQGGRTTTVQADMLVRPDGTLPDSIYVGGCEPGTPDGTLFVFDAYVELARPLGPQNPGEVKLATANFTIDSTAAPLPGLPNTGQGGMAPTLVLTPTQGPCASPLTITLRGAGFPAGIVPSYSIGIRGQGTITWGDLPTVTANGTFSVQLELHWCEAVPVLPGAVLVISAWDGPFRDHNSMILASATYTVTDSALPSMPDTGGGGMQSLHTNSR